jgi:hypothetical protein
MSMNLHSPQLDLWQTPTWVTYLALYDADGNERTLAEKKHIYHSWVIQHSDGVWETREELDACVLRIREHIKDLKHVTEIDII